MPEKKAKVYFSTINDRAPHCIDLQTYTSTVKP